MNERPETITRDRGLTVYVFNVGQGDHILLRLPNGEYGVIDFYHDSTLSAPPALGYLQKLRSRLKPEKPIVLSFVCLSHPDFDHIKGLKVFLDWIDDERNNVQLKNLWMWPGNILDELRKHYEDYGNSVDMTHSTSVSSDVSKQLRALFKFREKRKRGKRKVKVQYLQAVEKLAENAGGVKAVALAPLGEHVKKFDRQAQRAFVRRFVIPNNSDLHGSRNADQNLLSSILLLIYAKRHRLLFGGDAGKQIWMECLKHYQETEQKVDHGEFHGCFIKASHHGSKHSSSAELWPDILCPGGHVAISAGSKATSRHPHPETLEHIINAFQELVRPNVWSTNTCDACLETYRLPKQRIDWVVGKRPDLGPVIDKALGHYRSKPSRKRRQGVMAQPSATLDSAENLAAYIFKFDSTGDSIRVTKGVSEHARIADECGFKTEESPPFPLCAIRRGHLEAANTPPEAGTS